MARPRLLLVLSLAALVGTRPLAAKGRTAPRGAFLGGVAITLHDEDPERDYGREVDEVADLGARAAAVYVHLYQDNAASPAPGRHPRRTASDATLLRTIRAARALSLDVLLVPDVLLERPRDGEWRGKLRPPDLDAWFRAYEVELLRFARLAREGGATLFCVGSELGSLEAHGERWRRLIAGVRGALPPGTRLVYSANWDHHEELPFWDALDLVGLSGYYELARTTTPTDDELVAAWAKVKERVLRWRAARAPGKPLVFTEIGYASQDGCASKPWNYYLSRQVDLDEQRACYEAFRRVWSAEPALAGVFFYEWWGEGGPEDPGYTPRGKPAEQVVRRFFDER